MSQFLEIVTSLMVVQLAMVSVSTQGVQMSELASVVQ